MTHKYNNRLVKTILIHLHKYNEDNNIYLCTEKEGVYINCIKLTFEIAFKG